MILPSRLLRALAPCLMMLMLAAAPRADTGETERAVFQRARAAQSRGDFATARAFAARIPDYVLTPWLTHEDLVKRLPTLEDADVSAFLDRQADTWLGERLRRTWLRELARRGRWQDFLRHYRAQDDATLECQWLVARLRGPRDASLLDDIERLWQRDGDYVAACAPAFEQLYSSGRLDDARLWARLERAMDAGRGGAASDIAARLRTPRLRELLALWQRAASDPAAVLRSPALDARHESLAVALAALRRLARQDVDAALAAWRGFSARQAPADEFTGRAARVLALAAASSAHPARLTLLDAVPEAAVDADVQRYQLREALAAEDWRRLARWTRVPCRIPDEDLRWRYWRSRALAAEGATAEAEDLLRQLATERDYYGFLAADRLGLDYRFNDTPITPSDAERAGMELRGGLARMREFDALGMTAQGYGEWAFELKRMTPRELEVAAVVVSAWGRPERAIAALAAANAYDDLTLRFPLLFKDPIGKYAHARGLDAARVLAIVRAESAFNPGARSPAGALGLMQLMPETAKLTARRAGIRHTGGGALFEPAHNIALGTHYLAQMLARYDGNFAMAAAAYNAGPGRVRQWQRDECVPTERWIETIPFLETRGYARRALFYAALYQRRLGQPVMKLSRVMPPVPPRGAAASTCAA